MSKIEVNTVDTQCGSTVTVGSSGKNVKIEGNDIRSNDYKASDGGNIINQSGTTITLGASGDTINLASGASQSGFGRTGTVDWQTSIKTSTFTAVNGEGYFVNTSGGVVTVNLPAGSVGAIVSIKDYAQSFDNNTCTVSPNGSEKIDGLENDLLLTTEGIAVTLVYGDATKGWQAVSSNEIINAEPYVAATGGTITTCGNDKIHTFTGPGTFTVTQAAACATNNIVSHVIVAGGGGGGSDRGGGGGAGGFREVKSPITPYTASPLDGYPSAPNRVTVTAQSYPIVVGAGGAGGTTPAPSSPSGISGSDSSFGGITGAGGGGGKNSNTGNALDGGSGGGGSGSGAGAGGNGNQPPVSPSQGNPGGTSADGPFSVGAGGGGAGAAAANASSPSGVAPPGGAGVSSSITGSSVGRAGGGGSTGTGGPAGTQTGGGGGASPGSTAFGAGAGGTNGTNPGTANTGGGGGASCNSAAGSGGSGIVIIRYKFQ
jgi:hypothetical protein